MSSQVPSDDPLAQAEEEKLIQALIGRGLITKDEARECRQGRSNGEGGTKELLAHLVKTNHLTVHQARRLARDLETVLHQQIPGYHIVEQLGYGSMGTVYKAKQLSMDRPVAIKILKPKLAANKGFLQRFIREAHMAAKLSSNNIVQAIDVGSAGSLHYFVMEYIEGTTIKDELEAGKVFQEREALEIILQVAQALNHAHNRQLVHRDIKPANIIITGEGTVKLADMGLARQVEDEELDKSEKGLVIGTPYYIAPELIKGRIDPDTRADIYSLGATLYHMVTGRPPFPGAKTQEVLKAHLNEPLIPPDHLKPYLSAGLGEMVEVMMAKDRQQRYRNPGEVISDLECLLREEPPKLARQKAHYAAPLESLPAAPDKAAEAEEEPEESGVDWQNSPAFVAAVILAILLGMNILLNLVMLLHW